jgi:hypothetical protein
VRVSDVGILVDFVRVVGRDAALRCERKLGNDVNYLLLIVLAGSPVTLFALLGLSICLPARFGRNG